MLWINLISKYRYVNGFLMITVIVIIANSHQSLTSYTVLK